MEAGLDFNDVSFNTPSDVFQPSHAPENVDADVPDLPELNLSDVSFDNPSDVFKPSEAFKPSDDEIETTPKTSLENELDKPSEAFKPSDDVIESTPKTSLENELDEPSEAIKPSDDEIQSPNIALPATPAADEAMEMLSPTKAAELPPKPKCKRTRRFYKLKSKKPKLMEEAN